MQALKYGDGGEHNKKNVIKASYLNQNIQNQRKKDNSE